MTPDSWGRTLPLLPEPDGLAAVIGGLHPVFHFGGISFFNDRAAAIREMIRVAKPGSKFVIGDENEALARKYEGLPVAGEC